MSLNTSKLANDMAAAFVAALKGKAPEIKNYAESESKKFAESLMMIEQLSLTGKIDQDEAKLQLEIQKNASRMVFLTIEGLGVLAVEQAINAALACVKDAVNKALGFSLL